MYDVGLRALALDELDGSGGCVAAAAKQVAESMKRFMEAKEAEGEGSEKPAGPVHHVHDTMDV